MRAACTIVVFTLLLVPLAGEAIALEDRGYQFADGVYEVIKVLAGRPRDLERHLDRLECSLAALEIVAPMGRSPRVRTGVLVAESAAATVAVARGSAVEEEFAHARHVGERPAERHVELTAEVGDRDLLLLDPLLLEVERLT